MNKNNHNVGCGILFIILFTFSIFFVTFIIARNQIKEHFIYGEVLQGVILEKDSYISTTSKGSSIHYWDFKVKPIDKYQKFILTAQEEVGNPMINNSDIGDTLTIKVQTEKQAKIISIKGEKINDTSSYFWILTLPFLLVLGLLPYYLILKQRKKHCIVIIKILILNILLAFTIAYFFTS
ncbi:MAG: hypothetical protein Q4A00_08295 [Flavobacteriaceae bacterium]|nr:hypothetical protein [Flavobacteriaceae bacterium]